MRFLLSTLGAAAVLGFASCKDFTSVDAPDVVQADDYATPAGATALAVGAVTQFNLAVGGNSPLGLTQVGASALIADELLATSSTDGTTGTWDQRDSQDPSVGGGPYYSLHDARQRLLSAITMFQRAAPDSSARIGQLFALLGYTSVFFGESFCAGVPLSHRDADLQPVYGRPLQTTQLFDSALVAFDSAALYGADSSAIVHLALVGRGRALLNQGRFSEAAAAVASVPTDYVYQLSYQAIIGLNNVFFDPGANPQWVTSVTVADREGRNGLEWQAASDPRVPLVFHPGVGGAPEVWAFEPYQAANAPIRLASGVEARLIEAEAALQAGDFGTWITVHNALRDTVPGLEPLQDPESTDARVDLHFRERAFWLFLTGHRHGDLRRLVRQYNRNAESVFPTGLWRDGLMYGTATNMTPPADEQRNPHYTGCLDRSA